MSAPTRQRRSINDRRRRYGCPLESDKAEKVPLSDQLQIIAEWRFDRVSAQERDVRQAPSPREQARAGSLFSLDRAGCKEDGGSGISAGCRDQSSYREYAGLTVNMRRSAE